MYSSSKVEFWTLWNAFIQKHRVINSIEMKYLINIYIIDFRKRFVKIFIIKMFYFDIINISREEDVYALLKRQLDVSIEDLKTMMKSIDLLLINEYQNHTFVYASKWFGLVRFRIGFCHTGFNPAVFGFLPNRFGFGSISIHWKTDWNRQKENTQRYSWSQY